MRKNIHTGWVVSGLVRDWLPPERVELGPRGECFPLSLYFWPSQPAPTLFTSIVLSSEFFMAAVMITRMSWHVATLLHMMIVPLSLFTGVVLSIFAPGAMKHTYNYQGALTPSYICKGLSCQHMLITFVLEFQLYCLFVCSVSCVAVLLSETEKRG